LRRLLKVFVALAVVVGAIIFATALAGGLMDDRAFTPEAVGQAH